MLAAAAEGGATRGTKSSSTASRSADIQLVHLLHATGLLLQIITLYRLSFTESVIISE